MLAALFHHVERLLQWEPECVAELESERRELVDRVERLEDKVRAIEHEAAKADQGRRPRR